MASVERTPHEQQTLVFSNPEDAGRFRERVENKVTQPKASQQQSKRQAISEELAEEFENQGEVVSSLHQPWEHSEEEHHEVQSLVNEAFEKDLKSALKKAREGAHYPRNLDLLHDVLTNQLYDLMVQQRINKQMVLPWVIAMLSITLVALIASIIVFAVA